MRIYSKEDILFEKDIDDFLEDIKSFCERYGGKAVKGLNISPDGEIERYLECIFPSEKFMEIDMVIYTTPKEWIISMNIGDHNESFRIGNLRDVKIYLSNCQRGFKGFKIRVFERKVIVDLFQ